MTSKKLLITGGAGFIGSAVIRHTLAQGGLCNCEIVGKLGVFDCVSSILG
jgi:nucleoside-diphosphate-sugar epimerase